MSEGALRRITQTLESCVKQPPNESTEGWRAAGSERRHFMQHFSHSETRHKKLSDTNCDMEGKVVIGRVRHKGDVSTDGLASCFWDHWDVYVMFISVKMNQELKPRQWFTLMVLNGVFVLGILQRVSSNRGVSCFSMEVSFGPHPTSLMPGAPHSLLILKCSHEELCPDPCCH